MSKPMYSNKRYGKGGGGDGKSAYDVAVDEGYEGSESEWLLTLEGSPGTNGTNGSDGKDGTNGSDGFGTEEEYDELILRLNSAEAELEAVNLILDGLVTE